MPRHHMYTPALTYLPGKKSIYLLTRALRPSMDLWLAAGTGERTELGLKFSEYKFDVLDCPGVKRQAGDAL